MKLNKVISLVLGGVMALSMLTACGGTTTTTTTPIDDATTNNTSTGVVAYVQSNMDENKVGRQQTEETLAGNEDTDLAFVKNVFVGRGSPATTYYGTALTDTLDYWMRSQDANDAGDVVLAFVPKGGWTESDMGKDVLAFMADRYTQAKYYSTNATYPTIGSISVFDFSGAVDTISVGAAIGVAGQNEEYNYVAGGAIGVSASGDTVISVNGSEVDLADCWVIVITLSKAAVLS